MGRMLLVRAFAVLAVLCAAAGPALAVPAETRFGEAALPRPTPRLVGYRIPVEAPLVLAPELIPGAPREYRGGVHEGVDIAAPDGASVRAARAGKVVRIDRDYVEWPELERARALAEAVRIGGTPLEVLDRVRGRQVWLDHDDGVVTRYAHLGSVAALALGERVFEGEVIGTVGSSGLPEGGPHLHFEIRVGEGYLGQQMAMEDARAALALAFSPERPGRECER